MSETRLLLVRHGETGWNALRRIQGQTDIDLNAVGERQARAVARRLAAEPVAAIHSSDLLRAWRTAEAIGAEVGVAVIPDAALRERHWGRFQGTRFEDIAREHPADHARLIARDPAFDAHGGESLEQLALRTAQALRAIAARHAGETVVVVSHGGVLDCAYRLAAGRDLASPRDFVLLNAAINEIFVRESHDAATSRPDSGGGAGAFVLGRWGIDTHLADGRDELP
ncbi:MAG: histidine phosphatase family protein [Lautropia sp.]